VNWPTLEPNPYLDIHAPDDVRIRGTRIDMSIVVEDYLEGRLAEETQLAYPSLGLEAIYGVITYYLGHREAVDRYVAAREHEARDVEKAVRSQPEPPVVSRLKAILAARRAA
jgi:uncharacterized protein (DUF433 family)